MPADSELLAGGVNEVRRVGGHVVRPAGAHSPSVHRVLRHVREQGFSGCPEVISLDDDGTETLSFVPGEVTGYPLADSFRADRALVTAAKLLRAYHDASLSFPVDSSDRWFLPPRHPREVVCHGDFAPYNCVMDEGDVVGIFDFDTAHPGPRLWDVGYAAYRWVPLAGPTNVHGFGDTAEQQRRLHKFCDAYGETDISGVLVSAIDRLEAMVEFIRRSAAEGNVAFARHVNDGHDLLYVADTEHIRNNLEFLANQ